MSRRTTAVVGIATSAVASSVFVVVHPDLGATAAILLVLLAFAAWGVAVVTTRDLDSRRAAACVAGVIGAVLATAVLVAPRGSHDLWGYAVYGRMVSEHATSPYTHAPAAFPHDPLLPFMGSGYHHTRSPYGPAFTALSAAGTSLAGSDPRSNRLFFQGLEAIAVAGALLVLWRRTRRVDALVWVGLNPLVISAVVNDGHNDGLVMLCILAGAALATDRRFLLSGAVIALAALVKLPALLALGGLVIWLLRARGTRDAARATAAGAVVVTGGYAITGFSALKSIGDSGQLVSRASVWTPSHDLLAGSGRSWLADALPEISLAVIVALGVLLAWAGSRERDPATSTAGASSAFGLGGSYVLPWYATWGLPTFATRDPGPLAWLVAAQGAVLLVTYQLPHHADAAANGLFLHRLVTDVLPVAVFVAAVAIAVRELRRSPDA